MGAEFEDEDKVSAPRAERGSAKKPFIQSGALFKDPKAYRHLSKEQKEELTKAMMGQHRQLVRKIPGMGRG